jgi:hypothetical protein
MMRSPCRAFIDPVDVRPTGVAARPGGLAPRLAGRLARTATGVDRVVVALLVVTLFAVALFAVALFAEVLLAVTFFAVVFLAVVFLAVGFFAVGFLAVVFLAVVFLAVVFRAVVFRAVVFRAEVAVVLFAVVLVPFLFVGMVASLVTLTLGSTCLGDHRRRGDAPWTTVGDRDLGGRGGPVRIASLPGSGSPRKFRTPGPRGAAPRVVESPQSRYLASHLLLPQITQYDGTSVRRLIEVDQELRERQGPGIAVELPILPARYSRSVFLSLFAA